MSAKSKTQKTVAVKSAKSNEAETIESLRLKVVSLESTLDLLNKEADKEKEKEATKEKFQGFAKHAKEQVSRDRRGFLSFEHLIATSEKLASREVSEERAKNILNDGCKVEAYLLSEGGGDLKKSTKSTSLSVPVPKSAIELPEDLQPCFNNWQKFHKVYCAVSSIARQENAITKALS